MSTAHEVLAEVKAARMRADAEASENTDQWQLEARELKLLKQAKKSYLPQIALVLFLVIGLGVLALYTIDFLRHPAGDRGWRGFALPIFWILYMGIAAMQIQDRRAKALAELIRLKAPAFHEELKNKGVL
ncbi:MAG TPA: hypothetical protein VK178_14545 [Opitutaceae bacterium]|nr:hypothetical protein [Opitutaceae bacterium]